MTRLSARAAALVAAAALAPLALAGCGRKTAIHESEISQLPPLAVGTLRIGGGGAAPAELILPARIKAREEVTLTARLPGRVTALPVAEGAGFRAGALLAVFAAPEARGAVRAVGASVAAAKLRLETARLQESRMETLHAQKVAALRELELARNERQAAEATYEAAAADAERVAAQTSMTAPFDGVVVRHFVDPGAEVDPGQPLVSIRSSGGGAEIVVAIPESDAARVAGGRAAFQAGDGPWRDARLERLEGMTDYATRTRTAHLRPAGSGAAPALEPGAFARVRFTAAGDPSSDAAAAGRSVPASGTGRDSVSAAQPSNVPARGPAASYLVPAASLVRRGGLTGVFVVSGGRAHLRWVRPGRAAGDQVEILAGLFPGDEIAVSAAGLADGRRVTAAGAGAADTRGPLAR
jgi:RND family efflux transporter MFP subunit